MFAVFMSGGQQYKVSKNDRIKLGKIPGEPGMEVDLGPVLLIGENGRSTMIGSPVVEGGVVRAEIIDQSRDPKIIIFKKERRHNYRRKNGHRQHVTHVLIKDILKN